MLRRDDRWVGIVLGFLAPMLTLVIYYFIQFRLFTFAEFLQVIAIQKSLLTALISISLMANAVLFTIYINLHKDLTAKGIFIATCVYAIISLLIKLLA